MADKKFGVKQINLIGASGTPTLTSPNNLNINAINVAISTDLSVGGDVSIGGTFNALSVAGVSTFQDNVNLGDDDILNFGSANNLQISSNGSAGVIKQNTSNLFIRGSGDGDIYIQTEGTGATAIRANHGADVKLYYNNNEKFATTNTGVQVTGTVTADGLNLGDNDEIQLGSAAAGDLLITHLSSTNNSLIRNKNASGSFIIDTATGSPIEIRHSSGGEPMGVFTPNGAVELYYDNDKKFETTSDGVTVSNSISIGTTAYFNKGNDKGIFFGVPPFDSGLDALIFVSDTAYANSLCFSNIDYGARFFVDEISLNRGSSQFVGLGTEKSHFGGSSEPNYMVGIGTTNPTSKLTVREGDISVGVDTSTGLILTSPNGTQYRLVVDNSGNLTTTLA